MIFTTLVLGGHGSAYGALVAGLVLVSSGALDLART